jgi:hypothetical protein
MHGILTVGSNPEERSVEACKCKFMTTCRDPKTGKVKCSKCQYNEALSKRPKEER